MSDRGRYNKGVKSLGGTYLKRGEYNAWCMRCGGKFKTHQLTKEWDELWVCQSCFEDRHPQDMVRGVVDLQATPWASPELPDTFILKAAITGLTTAPFAPGPELLWDRANTLSVQVSGGTLTGDTELNVLNGSNFCAVMNAGVAGQPDTTQQTGEGVEVLNPVAPSWEILQFTNAELTAPATYTLSGLLRGRYGTEGAMNIGTLPAGSPFVYIGQASASNDLWIQGNLGWLLLPWSPCYIGGFNSNGDQWFTWIRRSRIPPLWQDDWNGNGGTNFNPPPDTPTEQYEVAVLNAAGAEIRTLYATETTRALYPLADQIADFGGIQSAYSILVYQADPILGRGQGRPATVPVSLGAPFAVLGDGQGNTLTDTKGHTLCGGWGPAGTPSWNSLSYPGWS